MNLNDLIQADIIPYIIGFVIAFALIVFLLRRTIFRGEKTISAIIAAGISALIIWSLATNTAVLDFDIVFYDFSPWVIVIGVAVLFFIFVLFKALLGKRSKYEGSGILFSLAGFSIIAGVLKFIFSPFYLPEWLVDYWYIFIAVGVIFGFWAVSTIHEKKSVLEKIATTIGG